MSNEMHKSLILNTLTARSHKAYGTEEMFALFKEAWEAGAADVIGDQVVVVDICEGEVESVHEMLRLGAIAYTDGFGTGASYYGSGSADAYIWPDDAEDMNEDEREAAEIAVAEFLSRKAARKAGE